MTPEYFQKVNDSLPLLKRAYDYLLTKLEKPYKEESLESINEACAVIVSLIPICHVDMLVPWVLRARYHEPNTPLLDDKSELSYNEKYKDRIPLGRFNKAKEPLFYAALPREQDKGLDKIRNATIVCAGECYKAMSRHEKHEGPIEFTFSQWRVVKPISVALFCMNYQHINTNKQMRKALEDYKKMIYKSFSLEIAQFIEEFFSKISEISHSSKYGEVAYQILSSLFSSIRSQFANTAYYAQGVIFPSSRTGGEGLNVVLTPAAVDGSLKLELVWMYQFTVREDGDLDGKEYSGYAFVDGDNFKIPDYKGSF